MIRLVVLGMLQHQVFHLFQRLFGYAKLEGEVNAIGHGERLAQNVDMVDEVDVDDEALANADKIAGPLAQAFGNRALHLRQVHAYGCFHLIGQYDVGIVAVALHIDYLRAVYAEQFIACINI